MTCAVVYKKNDRIILAADKQGTSVEGHTKIQYKQPKIIKTQTFAAAAAGQFQAIEMLHYDLRVDRDHKDPHKFMCKTVVPAIKALFKEREIEMTSDTSFLFVVDKKIFILEEDLHVCEPESNFVAIGSGANIAMGALYVCDKLNMSCEDAIKQVMNATSEFNITVSKKYDSILI